MIYHMVPVASWNGIAGEEHYESESFASQGFIHTSSSPEQLLRVANRLYKGDPEPFMILCIDESKIGAEIRHELVNEDTFPHIYGVINREAIVDVVNFPRDEDGSFLMPEELVG